MYKTDYGGDPFVVDINKASKSNNCFRTSLWTGEHLQLTLMSIKPHECIGLESHSSLDQFIRIEEGCGFVMMGHCKDKLSYQVKVDSNCAIFIPAGVWHNLINIGNIPLKLYSIYSPPAHPFNTVHPTKEIAEEMEHHHH